ncbi:MAG: hypothetical protein OQL08_00875 [Gammaproteobacteria bacterium]|nr:hypothetical protein [Gammaproteobacteria bacterium]
MVTIKKRVITTALLGLVASPLLADSGFSVGAEYSEGDYGTGETSRSWYLPVSWRYQEGNLRASLTVPYITVEGSALVTVGGTPLSPSGMGMSGGDATTTTTTTRTASGLGDVLLSGSYRLLGESDSRPWLAATATIKFGTADEAEGLGTGEDDYTLQLEAGKGPLSGYAGYTLLGDTATLDYNDVAFVGVALDVPLGKSRALGVEYYTEEAALSGMDDLRQATLSLNGEVSREMDYSLYYIAGLSDSSADSVIGVNFSSRLK